MVNPPRKPVMNNKRTVGEIKFRPAKEKHNPIKKHPKIFTPKVPIGKLFPNYFSVSNEKRYRQADPSQPPIITNKMFKNIIDTPIPLYFVGVISPRDRHLANSIAFYSYNKNSLV